MPLTLTFQEEAKDVARMRKLVVPITCSNPGETQQARKKRKIDSDIAVDDVHGEKIQCIQDKTDTV